MTEQIDLDALEALAKEADSWGGWAIWPDLTEGGFVHVGNEDGVIPEGQIATPDDAEANPIAKAYTPEIADFIAAADPSTVLALIAELRQERELADGLEANRRLWIADAFEYETVALSRAEETIEKALDHDPLHGKPEGLHCGGMSPCIRGILTEYGKQKSTPVESDNQG